MDEAGWLYVTGRRKEAINRGGETIAPGEVEKVLVTCPGAVASELMVFAAPHSQYGDTVGVAVASCVGLRIGLTQLRSWAAPQLPASMLPQLLVIIEELPRGANGKLLRARFSEQLRTMLPAINLGALQVYHCATLASAPRLLEEWIGGVSSLQQSVTPDLASVGASLKSQYEDASTSSGSADSILTAVLAVVSEFVTSPAADTHLPNAGVNSLAAIDIAERLGTRLHMKLPTSLLSDYPTPSSITSHIRSLSTSRAAAAGAAIAEVVTISAGGDESLSCDVAVSAPSLRVLLLHGEAADASLMELSMRATGWLETDVASKLQFVFMDAPLSTKPQPRFHRGAVAAGVYLKAEYRSWGVTERSTLERSLHLVSDALATLGPIHGVGGICDGGLVAALIASRHPHLLYINLSSSPFSRLPVSYLTPAPSIQCAWSVHLMSPHDELWSFGDLQTISAACERATVLQHDRGHAVPPLRGQLKQDVFTALRQWHSGPDEPKDGDEAVHDRVADSLRAMAMYAEPRASQTTGEY